MLQPWNEIIETQKVRSDLLKWKVIVVAALGATGLGLSGQRQPHADIVLCCIPLVCAYIDALCRHLSLRIRVISQIWERGLLRNSQVTGLTSNDIAYLQVHEVHVQTAVKRGILSLEDLVVVISSVIFSFAVLLLPIILNSGTVEAVLPHGNLIRISGFVGLILIGSIELTYRILRRRISHLPNPVVFQTWILY